LRKPASSAGTGSKQTVHLRPGLDLHIAGFKLRKTMKMDFEIRDTFLRFSFYLQGNGSMAWPLLKGISTPKKIRPIERCSAVSFYPESEGTICFLGGHHQSHLTVQISPALLNAFMGKRFRRIPYDLEAISEGCNTIDFFHNGALSPEMETAIQQIINCPYSGSLGKIYQESRAIELIAHKLAQIESSAMDLPASNKLRLNDVERVHHAKDILIRDLENPPRLFDLARAVGTTHTQLNRGFGSIFGTSVFGYLRKLRLERARHFLEQGSMNVTEAAVAVGYNSLSSFSRAFSAHFGLTPASYLKRDRQIELDGSGAAPAEPALAFQRKVISDDL
jgi:AraC family transcriptional regulator, transcriptional activator of the genes for pyochelin and ferripyochelin receptors